VTMRTIVRPSASNVCPKLTSFKEIGQLCALTLPERDAMVADKRAKQLAKDLPRTIPSLLV